jgi:hypothetical protein
MDPIALLSCLVSVVSAVIAYLSYRAGAKRSGDAERIAQQALSIVADQQRHAIRPYVHFPVQSNGVRMLRIRNSGSGEAKCVRIVARLVEGVAPNVAPGAQELVQALNLWDGTRSLAVNQAEPLVVSHGLAPHVMVELSYQDADGTPYKVTGTVAELR